MFIKPVPPQPMTADAELDEASLFVAPSYGATIGLVYYRCLGDPLRQAWDNAMNKAIDEARRDMAGNMQTAQTAWMALRPSQGRDAGLRTRQNSASDAAQNNRKKLDFLVAL